MLQHWVSSTSAGTHAQKNSENRLPSMCIVVRSPSDENNNKQEIKCKEMVCTGSNYGVVQNDMFCLDTKLKETKRKKLWKGRVDSNVMET